jgi:hypothetical protein
LDWWALAAFLLTSDAFADYPERTIRIIVPYTAGGTVDILARALGERMTAAWKQPVVIENRPGAGGSIGAEAAARATPDGYTLYMSTNSPLTTNVWLQKKGLNYDSVRDFAPITVAGENSISWYYLGTRAGIKAGARGQARRVSAAHRWAPPPTCLSHSSTSARRREFPTSPIAACRA